MNNKGFAISGIVYSVLILFLLLVFGILGLLGSRKLVLDKLKNQVMNELNGESTNSIYRDEILNGADPVLDEGMIPVIIAQDGSLTKADTTSMWYDYASKQWANAILVTEESREKYIIAKAGTNIDTTDVLAYYVWVPRYRYEIFTDVDNILTGQNYETNIAKQINIVFEDKNTIKSEGTEVGEYLTHPAFTFGVDELNGIWVGKFETTGTASNPTILPYTTAKPVTSLRSQNVSTQFATSQLFSNYGANNMDAHMMKNMEWGAVAYLTNSIYGRCEDGVCEEVRINNSSKYYTGCAATTAATKQYAEYTAQTDGTEGYYAGCENAYNTEIGVLASTTGNITGIYDMSGVSWEYVMAVMEDSLNSKIPTSGRSNLYNSGFNGKFTCPTCDGSTALELTSGTPFPESKYYDLYEYGTTYNDQAAYVRGKLGDATVELGSFTYSKSTVDNVTRYYSNWNKDYAHFVISSHPWLVRGGTWDAGSGSGVFAFGYTYGYASGSFSFRSVLVK